METKLCPKCNIEKELSEFYIDRKTDRPQTYCKPCGKKVRGDWIKSHPDIRKKYYKKYIDKSKEQAKRANTKLRTQVYEAYGNKCACCGASEHEFLTIDHVNNDGLWHRRELVPNAARGGNARDVMRDLKRRGFPQDGFRLLCYNCHFSRGYYGYCPHEQKELNGNISNRTNSNGNA